MPQIWDRPGALLSLYQELAGRFVIISLRGQRFVRNRTIWLQLVPIFSTEDESSENAYPPGQARETGDKGSEIVITRNRCPAKRENVGLAAIETQGGGYRTGIAERLRQLANRF